MTKDEILKKSRRENSTGDEREQQIESRAMRIGYQGCFLLCLVAWLLNFAFEGPGVVSQLIMFIYTGTLSFEKCGQAVMHRTMGRILSAIAWTLLCIFCLYALVHSYLQGV